MRILPALTVAAGLAVANPAPSAHVLEDRGFLDDIWKMIEEATTCVACQGVLVVLKGLAHLGDGIFVSTLTGICKISNLVDDDVCEGAIALEGPIIAGNLRDMSVGSKTSKLLCITFTGLCDYPDVEPWSVPFPSPKPASAGRLTPSGQTPVKVVHFSDTHVDPLYTAGANANCTKPMCCRPYTEADAPGNNDFPAGPNGDHNCDTPPVLQQSMFDAIKTLVPDAAFGIFTGDIIDHAIWLTSEAYNTEHIKSMYAGAAGAVPLLYGTAGNHEMSPTNAFPTTAQNRGDAQWVYDLLSSLWRPWIGSSAADSTAVKFGAYAARYAGGGNNLRVISLNTNMYYIQNYFLYQDPLERDPSSQLSWLVSELQAAEDAGDRVYIIGHMPLGTRDAFHDHSNYLDQIVNRYEATIAAMFFGHTHKDEFQVSYRDYGRRATDTAMAVSYIMPSLAPTDGHPAFRVYSVDPVTWAVLDIETYTADLSAPGFQDPAVGPQWKLLYSARATYGSAADPDSAELSPAFWHNVTDAMQARPDLLNTYLALKSRGWQPESCSDQPCLDSNLCWLRGGRAENNCHDPEFGTDLFRKTKRALVDGTAGRAGCGNSIARSTMATLMERRDLLQEVLKKAAEQGAVFESVKE